MRPLALALCLLLTGCASAPQPTFWNPLTWFARAEANTSDKAQEALTRAEKAEFALAAPTAPAIRYDRPSISVPEGMKPRDGQHYSDVRTDLERAWGLLGHRWSLPFQVVEWTMDGYELATIADLMRVPRRAAAGAYCEACRAMADRLGWRE